MGRAIAVPRGSVWGAANGPVAHAFRDFGHGPGCRDSIRAGVLGDEDGPERRSIGFWDNCSRNKATLIVS